MDRESYCDYIINILSEKIKISEDIENKIRNNVATATELEYAGLIKKIKELELYPYKNKSNKLKELMNLLNLKQL